MNGAWATVPMAELCSIQSGESDTKDAVADGPYAFFDRSRTIKRSSRFLRDCEALIIPGEGAVFLPRHFVGKFDLHQRAYALFDFSPRINVRYLYYYLHYVADYFRRVAVGATVKSLRLRHFEQLPVRLADLATQRSIVAILDEAFDAIAAAEANADKNVQHARDVFESHLAAVFSARNKGWTDRVLHSLCRKITVGHVGSMSKLYKPTGIPFLRSQNIRPFIVSMDNMVFIDDQFHATLQKSSLQPGDVAIVRTGYPGTAAVIPESLGSANCSDLVIVRPGPEVDAHFLTAFFNSAFGKTMVGGKVVGSAQKHFNVGAAKEVILHLPPLVEQQAIVARAKLLRDQTALMEGGYARKAAALRELKRALMHQAFTGVLSGRAADRQVLQVA